MTLNVVAWYSFICCYRCLSSVYKILLFANDIVLITDSDINLHRMLNIVNNWCHKWRLKVNEDKIVHFRKPQQLSSQFVFQYGSLFKILYSP